MSYLLNSVDDHIAAQESHVLPPPYGHRLCGRQRSVHELLGGEKLADIVLWRRTYLSAVILAGATALWILFEWLDCRLVSVLCWILLAGIAVLFVWSNACAFVNRPPPPVPRVQLPEDTVIRTARTVKYEIDRLIIMLHEIALCKVFLKVEASLWLLSRVGAWCDFLTLVYIGIVLALTVPPLYEKYEDKIDSSVHRALHKMHEFYEKVREKVKSIIPHGPAKAKKTQ